MFQYWACDKTCFSLNCLDCSLQLPERKGFELHNSDSENFGPNRSIQKAVLQSPHIDSALHRPSCEA